MPPASVHIPLLDFTKLHKPQQPTQSRAATKAMQPKQSMSQQHSKYQTIDANNQKSGSAGYNYYGSQQQQSQTIQHNTSQSSQKDYQSQLYAKKRNSYEQLHGHNGGSNQQMRQSLDNGQQQQRVSLALKDSNGISVSQSVKIMAPQTDESHQLQI